MNCMIGYIVIVFSKKDYDFVQEILKNFSNNYFKDEFNKRTGFCLFCPITSTKREFATYIEIKDPQKIDGEVVEVIVIFI